MTHSESHHTNYSLLKKKCCREVNRQRNTNNILLTLLFTIKRCLSISLKSWSKWNIQLVLRVLRVVLRGATRCYEVLHVILQELRCTTRQFWVTTSGTMRYCEVLQVTMRHYKWYQEVLQGNTSCTGNHYVVLWEVKGTTSDFWEGFSQRSSKFMKFYEIDGETTLIESLHSWNYNPIQITLLKRTPPYVSFCDIEKLQYYFVHNCREGGNFKFRGKKLKFIKS